jgi:hypothetical protein
MFDHSRVQAAKGSVILMSYRHVERVRRLRAAVLGGPGAVDPAVRAAVEARAARTGGRPGANPAAAAAVRRTCARSWTG